MRATKPAAKPPGRAKAARAAKPSEAPSKPATRAGKPTSKAASRSVAQVAPPAPASRQRVAAGARELRAKTKQRERADAAAARREALLLKRLRPFCERLPETTEVLSHGHPTFRVHGKTFAIVETHQGIPSLAIIASFELHQALLRDDRFYRTPYVGKHGWVSHKLDGRLDWKLIEELVMHSFRQVAPAAVIERLDHEHPA